MHFGKKALIAVHGIFNNCVYGYGELVMLMVMVLNSAYTGPLPRYL